MPSGYCRKVLYVNLTAGTTEVDQPTEDFYRMYLGGWGFVAHELLKRAPKGVDPFAPENPLIFATGVVSGTPVPGSGRHAVGAKSPLTGGFGEADVGGFWSTELKRAGFDAVVVTGAAANPVYLWITDNEVEIRDAGHLWGRKTAEVQEAIRTEHSDDMIRVIQCGVAGENLVRFACVISDVNRAAGRTGLGAVMGSKKLRAVAVRGTGEIEIADSDGVKEVVDYVVGLRERWANFHEHGTGGGIVEMDEVGRLPTRNFQEGKFEGAKKIAGTTLTEKYLVGRDTCHACPIGCKRVVKSDGDYRVDPIYGGPEYESLASLGSICGVDNLEAIMYANQLCNAYGLDTISTGVTIGWAMECFERGLLTVEETGGLELRFGDHAAMTELVDQIAHRKGFGDVLAEGSLRAARAVGKDTEKYAVQVKGQEFPMHDPRWQFGLGIGYATSPTGADHMHNYHDSGLESEATIDRIKSLGVFTTPMERTTLPDTKAVLASTGIRSAVMNNCIGVCMFMPYRLENHKQIVKAVTGWDVTDLELLRVGERALALARLYNAREGFLPSDDTHHPRFTEPLMLGEEEGAAIPEETMQQAIYLYYELQGWDKATGAPTRAKLIELSLGWAVELLPSK
ncbi:aldehyde ferredoxin oxidoreductase family protein [Candidatus Bipolaricaulota bacterium]